MNLISRFTDTPVLIQAGAASWLDKTLVSLESWIAEHEVTMSSDDDFWRGDCWEAYFRPYNVENGVLLIPVDGLLLNQFPYHVSGWATGYEYIEAAYNRGMEDGAVHTVAFVISSSGGVVAGNFDMVDRLHENKQKRVVAVANEYAFSAAYSIASLADHIYIPRTGEVGSIGVVTSHVDVSEHMDQIGWKITFIHAGEHKVDRNPYEPLSESARDFLQNRIDSIYQIFIQTVARNRGLEESAVQATEARIYGAEEAIELGLADEIMSVADALSLLVDEPGESSQTYLGETTMTEEVKDQDAPQATAQVDESAIRCEERTRVKAILCAEEAEGRADMAMHLATETEMSADDAVSLLATAPKAAAAPQQGDGDAAATAFTQAMEGDNPEVGADAQAEGPTDTTAQILADWKGATGRASH